MNDFIINGGLSGRDESLMFIAILMCKDYTDEQKEQVINAWNEDHKPKKEKKNSKNNIGYCNLIMR